MYLIVHQQHGFVPKKSCFTNLLQSFEAWTDAVDSGFGVDVMYLDYSKAFYSVPHLQEAERLWNRRKFAAMARKLSAQSVSKSGFKWN